MRYNINLILMKIIETQMQMWMAFKEKSKCIIYR